MVTSRFITMLILFTGDPGHPIIISLSLRRGGTAGVTLRLAFCFTLTVHHFFFIF